MLRAGRLRVAEPQEVAVRPAVARLVLDELVGQLVGRLAVVPARHRVARSAAPAAERLHVLGDVHHVRTGAADQRHRRQRRAPGLELAELGRHRQREDGRVVLGGASRRRDLDDARDHARAVGVDAATDCLRVAGGERPLRRVVAAALAAEQEEAVEPGPVIHRPGVSAGRVRHLTRARDRLPLRRRLLRVELSVVRGHVSPSLCGPHAGDRAERLTGFEAVRRGWRPRLLPLHQSRAGRDAVPAWSGRRDSNPHHRCGAPMCRLDTSASSQARESHPHGPAHETGLLLELPARASGHRRGSNSRSFPYQGTALPLSYDGDDRVIGGNRTLASRATFSRAASTLRPPWTWSARRDSNRHRPLIRRQHCRCATGG